MPTELDRALRLLGPLEGRIMRTVWSREVHSPFVVGDIHERISELAYTTLMTTVHRLADKGLLSVERSAAGRAHVYRVAESPAQFVARAGREEVDDLVDRLGDAALAAFASRLDSLPAGQRERLRRLSEQ